MSAMEVILLERIEALGQMGDVGQLYGSVSTRDIAEAVTAAGFTFDRRQVLLDTPIKSRGLYKTRVALHPEVIVTVTVNVAQSQEEAEAQAAEAAAQAAAAAAEAPAPAPASAAEAEPAAEPAPKKARKKKSEE